MLRNRLNPKLLLTSVLILLCTVCLYAQTVVSGTIIDAVFGQKSVQDRIVTSVNTIGTTNTLLGVIGKRAVQIYKQGVK